MFNQLKWTDPGDVDGGGLRKNSTLSCWVTDWKGHVYCNMRITVGKGDCNMRNSSLLDHSRSVPGGGGPWPPILYWIWQYIVFKRVFGLCIVASEQKLKEGTILFPKKTEKLAPSPTHTLWNCFLRAFLKTEKPIPPTLKLLPTGLHSIKTGVGIKMFINQLKWTDPVGVGGGGGQNKAVYCRVEGRCDL